MNILTISGSSRASSSNAILLDHLFSLDRANSYTRWKQVSDLPLFQPELDVSPLPDLVLNLKDSISKADAVIISTPEYIHNIPAQLKNLLEWITSSGELVQKKVLPITYTPNTPRGERAMQSLLWSLEALDCQVVASLAIYQNETVVKDGCIQGETNLLKEALSMLSNG